MTKPESKKKSGLLPEKRQISRSAHRATNTNPKHHEFFDDFFSKFVFGEIGDSDELNVNSYQIINSNFYDLRIYDNLALAAATILFSIEHLRSLRNCSSTDFPTYLTKHLCWYPFSYS